MLEQILESPDFPSNFSITEQKEIFSKLGGNLPLYFENIDEISKEDVIELIKEGTQSNKEELLAILFWGVYFKAVKEKPKKSFIDFMKSENFDVFMEYAKKEIIDSDSPSDLFKKFSKRYKEPKTKKYKIPTKKEFESKVKAFKIPGIQYAYFTKLFFFYREALAPKKPTYLILDKWLSRAWCAIDGTMNNNTAVLDSFYSNVFDGTLSKQKPLAYSEYTEFMKNLATDKEINIIRIEEKLFGVDLKISNRNNLFNPRNEYINWAEINKIKLKREKKIIEEKSNENGDKVSITKQKKKEEEISGPFYLKKLETGTYYALRIEPDKSKKVGYIRKGWLHASEELKGLLDKHKLDWKDASKDGGSKEIWKNNFKTDKECIDFLKKNGII